MKLITALLLCTVACLAVEPVEKDGVKYLPMVRTAEACETLKALLPNVGVCEPNIIVLVRSTLPDVEAVKVTVDAVDRSGKPVQQSQVHLISVNDTQWLSVFFDLRGLEYRKVTVKALGALHSDPVIHESVDDLRSVRRAR